MTWLSTKRTSAVSTVVCTQVSRLVGDASGAHHESPRISGDSHTREIPASQQNPIPLGFAHGTPLRHRLRRHRHQGRAGRPRDRRLRRTTAIRIDTPEPSTPQAVAEVFGQIVDSFPASTRPGRRDRARHRPPRRRALGGQHRQVVDRRRTPTRSSPRPSAVRCTSSTTRTPPGSPRWSTAPRKGRGGLVMVITLGTGIGSAMICDGQLVPNSEMGHLEIDGARSRSRGRRPAPASARACPGRRGRSA